MTDSNLLIQERFKKLPAPIQEKVTSPDTQRLVQEVGKRYGMHIDEMGALENELILVLLGLEMPQAFPHNLMKAAHVSEEEAGKITKELNEKIFEPLREEFRLLYKKDIVEEEEQMRMADPSSLDHTDVGSVAHDLPEGVYTGGAANRAEPELDPHDEEVSAGSAAAATSTKDDESDADPANTIEGKRLAGESHVPNEERTTTSLKAPGERDDKNKPDGDAPKYAADPYREPIG